MEELFDLVHEARKKFEMYVTVEVMPDKIAHLQDQFGNVLLEFNSLDELRTHLNE